MQIWPIGSYICGILFSSRYMSSNPLYTFFKRIFAIISNNRQIITGTGQQHDKYLRNIAFNLKHRLIFMAFAFSVASYVAMISGNALAEFLPDPHRYFANIRMFLITSSGWILTAFIAYFFLSFRKWVDYLGHLSSIMLVGVLMFLPWLMYSKIFASTYPITLLLGILVSLVSMGIQHKKRIRLLHLGQRWNLIWFLCLVGSAAFWGWHFFC